VTINGDKVTRNPAYYIIAHAAKFVRPGSIRIGSDASGSNAASLPNVTFHTPAGKTVLIVLNTDNAARTFTITDGKGQSLQKLGSGAVGTYVW
jgi:glucosylceramidase